MTQDDGLGFQLDMDPEDAVRVSAYREASERLLHFQARSFSWLVQKMKRRDMVVDSWLFALGYGPLLNARTEVEIARAHGVTKQAICNLVKTFQENVRLEPMPGQRQAEAASKFREARLAQLSKP